MGEGARPMSRRGGTLAVAVAVIAVAGFGLAIWSGTPWGGAGESRPLSTLAAPVVKRLRIIFPEGFTRREMAARVRAVREIAIEKRDVMPRLTEQRYLAASRTAAPPVGFRKHAKGRIEGFLFPSTYEFTEYTTARKLVADQLATFRKRWANVDLRYARSKNLTPYDVLIIASMIEKETVAPEERRLVAAVIYNRLRKRMPLGIDATIRYGLNRAGTESLRKSDIESDNAYNTRRRNGLPPTPISNPGLASMQAAANPARVDYVYYVRKPDKMHHFFTADEQVFLRKVCEYGFGCG